VESVPLSERARLTSQRPGGGFSIVRMVVSPCFFRLVPKSFLVSTLPPGWVRLMSRPVPVPLR
jgi:hypothetical protein